MDFTQANEEVEVQYLSWDRILRIIGHENSPGARRGESSGVPLSRRPRGDGPRISQHSRFMSTSQLPGDIDDVEPEPPGASMFDVRTAGSHIAISITGNHDHGERLPRRRRFGPSPEGTVISASEHEDEVSNWSSDTYAESCVLSIYEPSECSTAFSPESLAGSESLIPYVREARDLSEFFDPAGPNEIWDWLAELDFTQDRPPRDIEQNEQATPVDEFEDYKTTDSFRRLEQYLNERISDEAISCWLYVKANKSQRGSDGYSTTANGGSFTQPSRRTNMNRIARGETSWRRMREPVTAASPDLPSDFRNEKSIMTEFPSQDPPLHTEGKREAGRKRKRKFASDTGYQSEGELLPASNPTEGQAHPAEDLRAETLHLSKTSHATPPQISVDNLLVPPVCELASGPANIQVIEDAARLPPLGGTTLPRDHRHRQETSNPEPKRGRIAQPKTPLPLNMPNAHGHPNLWDPFDQASLAAYLKLVRAMPRQSSEYRAFVKGLGPHEDLIARGFRSVDMLQRHEVPSTLPDVYALLHISYAISQTRCGTLSVNTPAEFKEGLDQFRMRFGARATDGTKTGNGKETSSIGDERNTNRKSDRDLFDEIVTVMWSEIRYGVAWIGKRPDWGAYEESMRWKMKKLQASRDKIVLPEPLQVDQVALAVCHSSPQGGYEHLAAPSRQAPDPYVMEVDDWGIQDPGGTASDVQQVRSSGTTFLADQQIFNQKDILADEILQTPDPGGTLSIDLPMAMFEPGDTVPTFLTGSSQSRVLEGHMNWDPGRIRVCQTNVDPEDVTATPAPASSSEYIPRIDPPTDPPDDSAWVDIVSSSIFLIITGFMQVLNGENSSCPQRNQTSAPYAFLCHPGPNDLDLDEPGTLSESDSGFSLRPTKRPQDAGSNRLLGDTLSWQVICCTKPNASLSRLLEAAFALLGDGIINTVRHFEQYVLGSLHLCNNQLSRVEHLDFAESLLRACCLCATQLEENMPRKVLPKGGDIYNIEYNCKRLEEQDLLYSATHPPSPQPIAINVGHLRVAGENWPSENPSPATVQTSQYSSNDTTTEEQSTPCSISPRSIAVVLPDLHQRAEWFTPAVPAPGPVNPSSGSFTSPIPYPFGEPQHADTPIPQQPMPAAGVPNSWVCWVCGHTASVKSNVRRHMKVMHPELGRRNMFRCTTQGCSYETARKDNLPKHLKNVHGLNTAKVTKSTRRRRRNGDADPSSGV